MAEATTPTTTTYGEACDHVAAQFKATGGLVLGGTFLVDYGDGVVGEVELRYNPDLGIVRPVYS